LVINDRDHDFSQTAAQPKLNPDDLNVPEVDASFHRIAPNTVTREKKKSHIDSKTPARARGTASQSGANRLNNRYSSNRQTMLFHPTSLT